MLTQIFSDEANCRTWKSFKTGCYNIINEEIENYAKSKAKCEKVKGYLVEINTKEENEIVHLEAKKFGMAELMLGITDSQTESEWLYSSGKKATFFNWDTQEPNGKNTENCADMRMGSGKWNDIDCSNKNENRRAICEVGGVKYHFLKGPLTWTDANKKCKENNWQLAEIHSQDENVAVLAELKKRDENTQHWIGLSDSAKEGSWVWSSGQKANFLNFNEAVGEPNGDNTENCVTMYIKFDQPSGIGKWNDLRCDHKDDKIGALCEENVKRKM